MLKTFIASILVFSKILDTRAMEPFIVGGERAEIKYYSHSAFLSIENAVGAVFVCGSSIVNQQLLLTAAHCFEDFEGHSVVTVRAGSAHKLQGSIRYASRIAVHRHYRMETVENDIALILVKRPFVLGNNIKRISLTRYRPKVGLAHVAGWGLIDENRNVDTSWLQQTKQRLWSRKECKKILHNIPEGSICGGSRNSSNYAAPGDSGSALVARGFVQIGLVSFKRPHTSQALAVYTDVVYFYDWIVRIASRLVCL